MKKAFTMLELVFVIVVIGILAAIIIPRTQRDNTSEATIELQSQIRYAQHLAIINDKFDPNNPDWFKNLWQIRFDGNKYSLVSDNNTRFAQDPQTNGFIQNIDLNEKYNVTLTMRADCTDVSIISFDHLGRPLIGDLDAEPTLYTTNHFLQNDKNCSIEISDGSTSHTIRIHGETGYLEGI